MKYLMLLFLTTANILVVAQTATSVKQFSWLEGTWKQDSKDVYEQWEIASDTLIRGASFYKDGNEYKRSENIELLKLDSSFYYIPLVFGQNNNLPVKFRVTSFSTTSFVAENQFHDFPQKIAYVLTGTGQLHIYIEGTADGHTKRIDFYFSKE